MPAFRIRLHRIALYIGILFAGISASCSRVEISVGNLHGGSEKYWRIISTVVNGRTYAPVTCEANRRLLFRANGTLLQLYNYRSLCATVPDNINDTLISPPDTFLVQFQNWAYNPNGNRLTITTSDTTPAFDYTVTELSDNQMVLFGKQGPNSFTNTYQPDNR